MRRVLLVSFFFPPTNAVGSIRHDRFARHLPEHGWDPQVLTVDRFLSRPATLASSFGEERITRAWFPDPTGLLIRTLRRVTARVERATPLGGGMNAASAGAAGMGAYGLPARLAGLPARLAGLPARLAPLVLPGVVRMPDRALPWVLPAVAAGLRVLGSQPFDAILSTSPPSSANLVASLLCRLSGLPWVADFRDLWTQNHFFSRPWPWHQVEELLERWVMAPASHLITVSEPLAARLRGLHGLPTSVITNGFEDPPPAASPFLQKDGPAGGERPGNGSRPPGPLTLTYTGSIYPARQDPTPLFEALAALRERRGVTPRDLEVRFVGSDRGHLAPLIARHGLQELVRVERSVSQPEAVALQRSSDVLLFFTWNDPDNRGIYSLKVFEYLGACRPVLCVGPPGTVADELLADCHLGHALSDPGPIAAQIESWLENIRRGEEIPAAPDEAEIRRYHVRELTAQLAEVLHGATQP